ncbi:MAG: hypothetical protein LQ342_008395 [Letrouitia transgressa]|nr:MAG: hypothetical protein LQ342_008395 [Letrouitia transgressa]
MLSSIPYTFAALALFMPFLASGSPVEKKVIDIETFENIKFFEQFAAAAYCPDNNKDKAGGTKVTCPKGNSCPLVEADNVTTVIEFENSRKTDVTGFLAIDTTKSLIILSFRGSHSLPNWRTNIRFIPVNTPNICPTCSVSRGFYESWTEARTSVLDALKRTQASYPSYKLVVTGHSLGGAVASIAAAEIRNLGTNASLYTYGQPRIGEEEVNQFITNQNKGGNYRVTHTNDIVPKLPGQDIPFFPFHFKHISPEYFITSDNGVEVKKEDIKVCEGIGTRDCNAGTTNSSTEAHGWYFNAISACR